MPNFSKYQESISNELIAIKDRVRDFIDDKHWGEDGRYKEDILRSVIENILPDFAKAGTGFIIGDDLTVSSQIDILIYRNDIPVLFQKSDFVIVSADAVLGIIEVKSKLDSSNVVETFEKSDKNGRIVRRYIFNGIFSYDQGWDGFNRVPRTLCKACKDSPGFVNNVALGQDVFMKFWSAVTLQGNNSDKYRLYKIRNLSFGYFISNLMEDIYIITGKDIPEINKRFMYPIENTKEAHRINDIII